MRRHRGSRPLTIAVRCAGARGRHRRRGHVVASSRGPTRPSIGDAVGRFRSSSTSTGAAVRGPDPGVYVYEGTGDEHLSFMATSQSAEREPSGHGDARTRWLLDVPIEYNSFHKQTWTWSAADGRLVDRGNTTDQKFDFGPLSQSEHTEVVCDPPTTFYDPATKPGHETPVRCKGRSETTKANMDQRGRVTFVGRTTIVVGDTTHCHGARRAGPEDHRRSVRIAARGPLVNTAPERPAAA